MALKTLVKVGEINNLSDARYCAGMGVDLVGFTLAPGMERTVDKESYIAMKEWIQGVKYVGEFHAFDDIAVITKIYQEYGFDLIQTDLPKVVQEANKHKVETILRIQSTPEALSLLDQLKVTPSYFLLEGNDDELSDMDTKIIEKAQKLAPVLLGKGLSADNIEQSISRLAVAGVSLKGGDEIRPGYKDFDQLADILEELEID